MQTELLATVRTHLPEVTVVGMDIQLAIKQAKNTDTLPNYQATLAFLQIKFREIQHYRMQSYAWQITHRNKGLIKLISLGKEQNSKSKKSLWVCKYQWVFKYYLCRSSKRQNKTTTSKQNPNLFCRIKPKPDPQTWTNTPKLSSLILITAAAQRPDGQSPSTDFWRHFLPPYKHRGGGNLGCHWRSFRFAMLDPLLFMDPRVHYYLHTI